MMGQVETGPICAKIVLVLESDNLMTKSFSWSTQAGPGRYLEFGLALVERFFVSRVQQSNLLSAYRSNAYDANLSQVYY